MRPSNNMENKILSGTTSMYESSSSQFFKPTTKKQVGLGNFHKSGLVMTFLTTLGSYINIKRFEIGSK